MAATRFEEKKLVLLSIDLAGFTRATAKLDALGVAALLEAYYAAAHGPILGGGGAVVKVMGDGILAVFHESACVAAVDAAIGATQAACDVAQARGMRIVAGANLHLAVVAAGTFSVDERYDVAGSGVNHVFLMGSGPGVRISEPVYRQLPNERRAAWKKSQPPAMYAFSE
jgi:adenylate cyclase